MTEKEAQMPRYPLRLIPISRNAIWGGKRLLTEWNKIGVNGGLAESWELSVRSDETVTIANGPAKGMRLDDYFRASGWDCVSPTFSENEKFPLLAKLIDAGDCLSVQVHPDDAYAAAVEGDLGKTEMWYVVEADEGASIICGLQEGVSREDFQKALAEGRLSEVMHTQPVRAGEHYFIPSGQLHAIGAGILIAEIQQNSDLTYRVYDYERRQADGTLRPLHVAKAIDVVKPFTEQEVLAQAMWMGDATNDEGEMLVNCQYFSVSRLAVHGKQDLSAGAESFTHLLCVAGEGRLRWQGESFEIARGDSYWIPAGMGAYALEGTLTVLLSRPQIRKI